MSIENKIFFKRMLAFVIDYLIILVPSIVLMTIVLIELNLADIGLAIFTSAFTFLMPVNVLIGLPLQAAMVLSCIAVDSVLVVYFLYCVLLEIIFGSTVGGKCARIRCINKRGIKLSKIEILVRNILKLLTLFCFLLGLITVFFKHRKPVYDIICKTDVVNVM